MVDFDGVVNLDVAAPGVQLGPHLTGVDAYGQGAVGSIVHGQVPPPLLKDHLGVDLPHPQERDPVPLDLEGGQGTLQAGELALLIAQGVAVVPVGLQAALRDQLDGVIVLCLKGLLSLDGNNHVVLHGCSFLVPRSNCKLHIIIPNGASDVKGFPLNID